MGEDKGLRAERAQHIFKRETQRQGTRAKETTATRDPMRVSEMRQKSQQLELKR